MPYYRKNYSSKVPVAPAGTRTTGGGGYYRTTTNSDGRGLARYQPPVRTTSKVITKDKSFYDIRQQCLNSGVLFEDPEFPANDSALFYSRSPRVKFEWKRPKDICADPQLFVGGASRFDIKQGELGDCWLLAAIASLSLNDALLRRIIPEDQSFNDGEYAGIFHFQFWQYGEWVDVIVDDLLPTHNGRLVYLHSAEKNEFWSALLEKAYAKLNGSYESLKGGSTTEAMEDFTGGVTEIYELNKAPKNLFKTMQKSLHRGALMGCAIETKTANQLESKLSNGLIMGHAYSVTGCQKLKNGTQLVRVRNPWGDVEWKGAWSDKSTNWRSITDSEKRQLELEFGDDGEFWMSFSDFSSNFTKLEICNLGPDAIEDDDPSTTWVTSLFPGRWIRGTTAGGCRNFPDTFWVNPQFRLTLLEEDDDPEDDEDGCSFLVSLMQKNRRKQKAKGMGVLTIGFAVYKLTEKQLKEVQDNPLKKEFFLYNASTARSPNFINLREISGRFRLPAGNYVIVPSTYEPNQEAEFVLRIFTEKRSGTSELDEETEFTGPGKAVAPAEAPGKQPTKQPDSKMDHQFRQLFDQLTGDDGEIDAFELQEILNSVLKKKGGSLTGSGFSCEASRSMIALMDSTQSGKLDYEEFKNLWITVKRWIDIFNTYDKDKSGTFDTYELRGALTHAGFRLNNSLYTLLSVRYANKHLKVDLDDFVLLSVRLETMFKAFESHRRSGSTTASMTLDEWLLTTMYA